MKKIKVVFMGTPDFAVPILEELNKHVDVVLVVSQPDKLVGRHQVLTKSPVKLLAEKLHLTTFQPTKIKEDYQPILDANPDLIVTCAYGQIIPTPILNAPRLGCINTHASLLPYLRGGAPIHHALIDGYEKTGITIMYMDETMDTGDIIAKSEYVIKSSDNVGTLHDELSHLGANLLVKTLPSIIDQTNPRIPQDHTKATYAYNIKREEEHLEFNKTSKELYNQIRGLNPWPTANLIIDNEEFKILESQIVSTQSQLSPGTIIDITKESIIIKTKDSALAITKLKPFGKRAMSAKDYLNGISKDSLLNKIVR